MSRILVTCTLILCSMLAGSCSFHRRVAGKHARKVEIDTTAKKSIAVVSDTVAKATVIKDTTATSLPSADSSKFWLARLTPIWESRLSYNTFSGKAKVHYEAKDNSQEFTANFRLKRDSVIWVTITAMGGMVQAARLMVTPDSLFMINYIDKEVIVVPLTEIAKVLPAKIDFYSLQNLIVGDPLRNGRITKVGVYNGLWSLDVADTSYLQHISYQAQDSTMMQGQIRTADPGGPRAMMDYGEYELFDGRKVATKRVINVQNGDDIFSLDIKFTTAAFDELLDFPFNLPRSYSRRK